MDIYQDPRNRTWRDQWAKPSKGGKELDQLAVDPAGRLVLIELKDGSKRSEVYYAPFQLLQYVWEWHAALGAVWSDLQKLIGARVALGLAPQDAPRLNGGIRAVVGFGRDTRSDEVKRRYRKVLDVANEHLPPGVGPIETWEITDTWPTPALLHQDRVIGVLDGVGGWGATSSGASQRPRRPRCPRPLARRPARSSPASALGQYARRRVPTHAWTVSL